MPADVLGGRVHHDSRAVLERAANDGRGRIVHDQRYAELAPDRGHFGDRKYGELGVGERLGIVGAGAIVGGAPEGFGVGRVDEAHLDAHRRQRVGEQVPGAAVQVGGADDVVARSAQVLDRQGRCRLSRADRERRNATLQSGDLLLEGIARGVHDARVDVAEVLQREQVGGVLRAAELIGRGLVDRHGYGAGGRVVARAGVQHHGLGVVALDSH